MKIELKNICKTFNKQSNTINNLDMTINDGEFVALVGPSGCGKSTTMLMIAGIYKPTSGNLYFDGQLVNDLEPKDRNIGMVFQSYALYPHMTVLDNIAFPLKQQKVPKEERYERAKNAADMVHLGHLLDRKPSQLSGGQQQRVALARAIVKKPKVLLLDEPMSNLDARLKIEMREEISRIQKELGITAIMVTHDQEEAMTTADRVAIMKEGELIQYSSPMELYNRPKNYFVAQFIGNPPMNFLKSQLAVKDGKCQFYINDTTVDLNNHLPKIKSHNSIKDIYAGIRPYDLKLGQKGDITLDGVVSLVEPTGHSKMVNVKVGDDRIRFFADPLQKIERGSKITLTASISSIHLFDCESGENLTAETIGEGQDNKLVINS
ncbi:MULTISPECIES: ABC transporter ATP-binding protein [Cytobacillus]|uniref:ABC transporter ATP-binding protein n=1 Tax=Cytobacillus TaxID=2675230 RepID=UPI00203E37EA|nr:ABC transporter ATP-binding protein [Cytobacillus firmus]MCM3706947.1 ABC transporter ATP-binding protein [Cytobacillus firmus]